MTHGSIGYLNGHWLDIREMSLGIDDVGFLQGVTAVERLRTWNLRLPLVGAHLRRFRHTTESLWIRGLPSADELAALIDELLRRNGLTTDTGIVLFATPGRRASSRATAGSGPRPTLGLPPRPTLGLHCSPLDFDRLERQRRTGQVLVVSDTRQPPQDCWPRDIKVRCRVHYYLADLEARSRDPDALAVLIDDDGSVTETSTSNVAIVNGGRLIAPPADRVLPGVMLQTVISLAERHGIVVQRRSVSPEELRTADEVLLTGSEAGVCPVRQIDQVRTSPGPVCRTLQRLLSDDLGDATLRPP